MKKAVCLPLFVLLLLGFAACSKSSAAPTESAVSPAPSKEAATPSAESSSAEAVDVTDDEVVDMLENAAPYLYRPVIDLPVRLALSTASDTGDGTYTIVDSAGPQNAYFVSFTTDQAIIATFLSDATVTFS